MFVGGAPQKQKEKLNSMPVINPGYVITQKIIHTLQCMNYEGAQWAYQVVRENKGITKEVINKIENDREMMEKEKKRFEEKIEKSYNAIAKNKEWMEKKKDAVWCFLCDIIQFAGYIGALLLAVGLAVWGQMEACVFGALISALLNLQNCIKVFLEAGGEWPGVLTLFNNYISCFLL